MTGRALAGFNRTFLVLKVWTFDALITGFVRFNRTFLVLKVGGEDRRRKDGHGFNRTFLVLKAGISIAIRD